LIKSWKQCKKLEGLSYCPFKTEDMLRMKIFAQEEDVVTIVLNAFDVLDVLICFKIYD